MTMLALDPKNNFLKKLTPLMPAYLVSFMMCDTFVLSLFSSKLFLFHKWRAILVLSL